MTVGEKIQFFRKRAGLSQEELGQQLLVSRQTVSLWETGQTLPTVDNLSRLRMIFGVSVDELLCEESVSFKVTAQTQDDGTFFAYSPQELRSMVRHALLPACVWTAAIFALLICGFIASFSLPVWALIPIAAGVLCCFLTAVAFLIARIYRVCVRMRFLRGTRYCCELTDGELCLVLKQDEQVRESYRAPLSEVRLARRDRHTVTFSLRAERVCIGRRAWEQNKELRVAVQNATAAPTRAKRGVSRGLLLVAEGCLPISLSVSILFVARSIPRAWQVIAAVNFAAALPALACATVGLFLRYAHKGWKKNVLVGALLAAVLLAGGVTALVHAVPHPAWEVERRIGVVLPPCESSLLKDGDRVSSSLLVYYEAELCFTEQQVAAWEQMLMPKMNACKELPETLSAYLPSSEFGKGATCFLLFDVGEGRAVEVLAGQGYHEYVLFVYFPKENVMRIAKGNYQITE